MSEKNFYLSVDAGVRETTPTSAVTSFTSRPTGANPYVATVTKNITTWITVTQYVKYGRLRGTNNVDQ